MSFTGGCACGAVRYSCAATPVRSVNCHCRDCQRASGGFGANGIIVPEAALAITGEPRWYESVAESGSRVRRGFCPTCGSPLFSVNERLGGFVGLKAGSLDDPSWFQPDLEMWTTSAQPWARLDPDLPHFPKSPPRAR